MPFHGVRLGVPGTPLGGVNRANFYVDSVNGNDANSGTSAATAFATLEAAATAVGTKTNQTVALIGNSTWKGNFVVGTQASPVNGTKVVSYGSGTTPFIDASDAIANANFTLVPGASFTYQATINFGATVTGGDQRLIWENGKNLTQVAYVAGTELATPGTFSFSSYTASTATVLVRASDSSAIPSNGKTYEVNTRLYCILLFGNDCSVTGIRTRRQRDMNGSIDLAGLRGKISGCTVEDGSKHAAFLGDGGQCINTTFKNAYNGTSGSPNYLVFFQDVGQSLGTTVSGCTFQTDPSVVPANYKVTSVLGHTGTSGDLGAMTAQNNAHTNINSGYTLTNYKSGAITGDTFTNCQNTGTTSLGIPVTLTNVAFTITASDVAVGTAFPFNAAPASGRATISYVGGSFSSATYEPAWCGGNNVDYSFSGTSIACGNTSTRSPHGLIRLNGTGCTLTVNGCMINCGYLNDAFYNLAADTVYTGDNNSFIKTTNSNWLRAGVSVATTLAGWRTYSGQDANSTLV